MAEVVMNELHRECLIVGLFEDRNAAEDAVDALEEVGFDERSVGFAIRGSDAVQGGMITDATGTKDGQGAVTGLVAGGITGGILGAAAALLIPGIGPIIAGGVLTTALGGAAAGAATGGILGAMAGLGVSEEEAIFYEKELKAGKALVTVRPGPRDQLAYEILSRFGGHDIKMRKVLPPDSLDQVHLSDIQTQR
jgi:hypothetical protein